MTDNCGTKQAGPLPGPHAQVLSYGVHAKEPGVERDNRAFARTSSATRIPVTIRGQQTRATLIDAAAKVFVTHGFLKTKITDITTAAGVASGSFYTYFDSKEAIFRAVIDNVVDRMFIRVEVPPGAGTAPYARIEHATRSYVEAYRQEAPLMAILEQVATFNPEFRDMRRHVRKVNRDRVERGIRRFQEAGVVPADLPPKYAADALTSMVSNFCYMWIVFDEDYEDETAIKVLSRLWAQALGIQVD